MTNSVPIILEYIWLDGNGDLRSKYRTIYSDNDQIDIQKWNYDGSSTYQADTQNSEVVLNPIAYYPNPFFNNSRSFLVLCETFYEKEVDGEYKFIPTNTNARPYADVIFRNNPSLKPLFGIEQEYFMMTPCETYTSQTPLAFSGKIIPKRQGDYYCGVGNQHIKKRMLAEKHYEYCIKAGLKISGINAEVAPSQWEFQIGPCYGLEAGDQLWVARYILHKLSEEFDVNISFKPKPIESPWNGSGLHVNFSTTETLEENGLEKIKEYLSNMEPKHSKHIDVYGDNKERLSGDCETSNIDKFTVGYGNRGCSIRIPNATLRAKSGYFEDRRPASNANPYLVTSIIFKSCCLPQME